MIPDKVCCIIIIVAIVGITCLIIYKNKLNSLYTPDYSDNAHNAHNANSAETIDNKMQHKAQQHNMQPLSLGLSSSTIEPFVGQDSVSDDVKTYLDSRSNEIIQGQYDNIKRQQQVDTLTDRFNILNTELQKHINTNLTYHASGALNFY
uniref:Uncharacterized protein n=1 Tax=viral metagenome TaxID=1070528 RepID=A0A6C0HMU2_9ZZZZ